MSSSLFSGEILWAALFLVCILCSIQPSLQQDQDSPGSGFAITYTHDEMVAFWTPEAQAAAIPLPGYSELFGSNSSGAQNASLSANIGNPYHPRWPSTTTTKVPPPDKPEDNFFTFNKTGLLFVTFPEDPALYRCGAHVVDDYMIVTAAHCVFNSKGRVTYMMFVPYWYSGNTNPAYFGEFTPFYVSFPSEWQSPDWPKVFDYAFLNINKNWYTVGKKPPQLLTISQVVGGWDEITWTFKSWEWEPPYLDGDLFVYGYPTIPGGDHLLPYRLASPAAFPDDDDWPWYFNNGVYTVYPQALVSQYAHGYLGCPFICNGGTEIWYVYGVVIDHWDPSDKDDDHIVLWSSCFDNIYGETIFNWAVDNKKPPAVAQTANNTYTLPDSSDDGSVDSSS